MDNMETEEQRSAGAILCYVESSDIEVLLLTQNNAFYNRPRDVAVIDIGPKGQLAKGESEEQAALREIKEETGLDLKLENGFKEELRYEFDDVSRITGKRAHISKSVAFFLAYITQENINDIKLSQEHLGCRLVRIDDAIMEIRHESQKRILRVVEQYIKSAAKI